MGMVEMKTMVIIKGYAKVDDEELIYHSDFCTLGMR